MWTPNPIGARGCDKLRVSMLRLSPILLLAVFLPAASISPMISDALPHLQTVADDTIIRSMYGEHANHEPALFLMHSGRTIASRPAIGSWVS